MSVVKKDKTRRTVGLSPKVAWPAVALFGIGAALIVLHFVLKDDSDTLRDLGIAAIGASGVTGGLGVAAPPALQEPRAHAGTTYQKHSHS